MTPERFARLRRLARRVPPAEVPVLGPPACPNCGRATFARVDLAPARRPGAVGCPTCLVDAVDAALLVRIFAPSLLRW
jgi:hypothetical protein